MTLNYLQVDNLSKAYGEKVLFRNISFSIDKGQKVALIARNGTGKSSLMHILAGLEAPDSGNIITRKDLRIGYLQQNPKLDETKTILDTIFSTGTSLMKVIHDYEFALDQVKHNPGTESDNLLNHSISEMDASGAWDYETRAREILGQFAINDLSQPVSKLSGGQRKKIALARTLLDSPDLLLMDEPTNHLDFEMIEWLEDYLSREALSLLLVTHDRYFLDNVCDVILEMDQNSIFAYKGNYSYYLEKKEARQQAEEMSTEKAKNLYRTELEWIRRMPKARGTKSKARISAFDDLETRAKFKNDDRSIKFGVNANRLGGKIIEIEHLSKSFGDFKAVEDISYIFKRGEKIGIVGLNGTGKSTFLNLVAGRLAPDKGKISVGQTVVMSYYTQNGLVLNEDKRVIDIVKEVAEEIKLEKGSMSASQFLQHFDFSYPVQQAYFSALSGGERRRLYLLLQLIRNPNFLILDEPTNDLDIYTLQVLEEFLQDFAGCVLIVSHDRFLLDKLCDHVFVFEGEGKIKDFYGNYTDYYQWRIREQKLVQRNNKQLREEKTVVKEKKVSSKPTYKQLKDFETLEKQIHELETEKDLVMGRMNSGNETPENITALSVKYNELVLLIDDKTMQWMELAEIIENAKF
ncbi:MAG TPA: ABC-F family ATP-binding cassette domain-containing protein [Bacteroidales bacterium]|nr:ABC-F family ATP-binding cassette domain-containing protein [Bacteroidales bacterium]